MLAVNMSESIRAVQKFAAKAKAPFPMLLDADGAVTYMYGVRGAPSHIMIDGRGKIVGAAVGAIQWERVQSARLIRYLLDENEKP